MTNAKIEKIAFEVIKTLKSRFDTFPENEMDNRNAPFHEAFLNAFSVKLEGKVKSVPFLITLSSWLHGLSTTLGQSFFERVSHILSNGEKREFRDLVISSRQETVISDIITELKNGQRQPDVYSEDNILNYQGEILDRHIPNFTADVFYETDNEIIAIELKTVKPNSGVFKVEKEKILQAKTGLRNKYLGKKVSYYLGFPFDPTSKQPTKSNKERYFGYSIDFRKYFHPQEILLADELWNFLSGETGTMELILSIINSIAKPDFMDKFDIINQPISQTATKSKAILHDWFLFTELQIIQNFPHLNDLSIKDKTLKRILAQCPFSPDGKINTNRLDIIRPFLEGGEQNAK